MRSELVYMGLCLHVNCLVGWGCREKEAYRHRDFGHEIWIAFGAGLGIIILTLGGRV